MDLPRYIRVAERADAKGIVQNKNLESIMSSVAMAPKFSSPSAYDQVMSQLRVLLGSCLFLRVLALFILIRRGQKCIELESKGITDPKKYYSSIRVIHRRGLGFVSLKGNGGKGKKKEKKDVGDIV